MLQILVNTFSQIKIKMKNFGSSYYNYIVFHYYNDLIKLLQSSLVILLCLILFFSLFELLLTFICANLLLFLYHFQYLFFLYFFNRITNCIEMEWIFFQSYFQFFSHVSFLVGIVYFVKKVVKG